MHYLIGTTILWAFSFSLIGVYLSNDVDVYLTAVIRLIVACLVSLPFLRLRWLRPRLTIQLMALGGLQMGVMSLFYYNAFLLLTVPEILLFTIFTPLYITLIHDLLRQQFNITYLWGALLAIAGAAVIRFDGLTETYLLGFLVVQGSNISFALGQVGYKLLLEKEKEQPPQQAIFSCFYLGALAVTLPAWWLLGATNYPNTPIQWGVLIWLGVAASGVGYFLWNKGATQVSSGVLAIMNNAVIPAGLLVNLLIWGQQTNLIQLATGGTLMLAALWVSLRQKRMVTIPST